MAIRFFSPIGWAAIDELGGKQTEGLSGLGATVITVTPPNEA
jgi:hypothetical protein